MMRRAQRDTSIVEFNAAHFRDEFTFPIQGRPNIGKNDVTVFHQLGMNRKPSDPAADIGRGDLSAIRLQTDH